MIPRFNFIRVPKICFQEFRQKKQPCTNCTNDRLLDENNQPTGVCEWKGFNQITRKWYNNYDRAIQWTDGCWVRLQIAVDITSQIVTISSVRSESKFSMHLSPFLEQISAELTAGTQITHVLQIESDLWSTSIDYNQIDKVIRHIITNSCESITGKGRLKITAENYSHKPAKNVVRKKLASLKDGSYVKVSFEDSGRGIDRDDISKVFEPYYTTKQRGSGRGIGLGLAIAHSILIQHHGHIYVDSQKNHGTRVVFFLPADST